MEEEKYQKELFEFEQPKKSFSRLTDMLPKADFKGRVAITITLEKMVFISIGIMMAMVIVYALGVESGRSRAISGPQVTRQITPPVISPVPQNRAATIAAKNILSTAPIVPTVNPAYATGGALQKKVKTVAISQGAKPFTILASTFGKRENAQGAALILAKQGFNVAITYSEPYYRVCVGTYADKNGAEVQKDLIRVRRIYKDAMLKLR